MATITSYTTKTGTRYRVRYRKPDGTQTDKRGFKTKRAAQDWAAELTTSVRQGTWIDPTAGRVTVESLYPLWIQVKSHLKPSYIATLESTWTQHVKPMWATRQVATIRRIEVQAWAAEISADRSASVVHRAIDILAGILDIAVQERFVHENVARGFKRPRKTSARHTYLTWEQLALLAKHAGEYGPLVWFLGTTGLRWGEATALRGKHVDYRRKRIHVEVSVTPVKGSYVEGTPKSHETRSVPISPAVLSMLPAVMPDVLVWRGQAGSYLSRPKAGKGWWRHARNAARAEDRTFPAGFRIHDLRHTAASLAVSAGANVKAVQRMLGHASAAMTLDTYADLFDGDLDDVAARLDQHVRVLTG